MTIMPFYRLSVPQYHEMIRAGILTENDRCELIRGQLVAKMTIGDGHSLCVDQLNWLLSRLVPLDVRVRIQNPIVCADSEPEPDVSLIRLLDGKPPRKKPSAEQVLLVVEVADSTYDFDRNEKLPIYAENAIPEYWIVDLKNQVVEVYRRPQGSSYTDITRHGSGAVLTIQAVPEVSVAVKDILSLQ